MSTPVLQHSYRYLAFDLRTGDVLGELPLKGVSYSLKLSGVGDFSSTCRRNRIFKDSTYPGRVGLYVLRDEEPVWGGIITKRKNAVGKTELPISGKSFEWYLYKRFNHETEYYTSTDQLQIARDLVRKQYDGGIGLGLFETTSLSGVLRERVMFGYEFKTLGEELEQLSGLENGFDWNVKVYRDSSDNFNHDVIFAYPQAGVSASKTGLVFEYPGNIVEATIEEDAESASNYMYAIGAGEGVEQLSATAILPDVTNSDFPILEDSKSYKDVYRPTTLNAHAIADLKQNAVPIQVLNVTVRADADPQFGTYSLGDYARFRIEDDWYSDPSIDTYQRITGYTVDVDDTGIEKVTLELGALETRLL